ncbi:MULTISPECIES: K(+)-transporting ATPase subunit C [unclassified Microbacterium]|uniref:K(+)-transporting ATPase subunit C n=1 Tax=unclassified Microbacterium TaxID=2609290 RepID=UPI000CFB03C7|nr:MULTISPECIES: K(+)-transporting ATPase subunit C [unclassified Microbacterium]PQZ55370.1 potassium-transporting ATPase subunit C [Microbacterium sp. MYb43]PQZ76404.1 potassium-transporting ATPase subunit C [Microbacterium sp. MYb40]PRB21150.1 potassium-transporting ATPase subunit C [Microbacterium sp. MYb54]PRB26332.1 potassium-transporting ATPase subunit C [Microbacterium sp. MYb50]PRB66971.1 potassium-transporting ATPase subunit C [Microbacterium sp. MYb24]
MSSSRTTLRTTGVAVRAMLVLTLLLGVGYTLLVTGIGQLLLPWQANGSPLPDERGSSLIGQSFTDADGKALPEYFQSRPSAAGDGYDGAGSSGSNLGPENADLVTAIEERKAAIAEREGVDPSQVPADAVTASGSGLDPHISVAYARLQVPRVAEARGLEVQEVRDLVESRIQGRDLGFLGAERINVAELNLALDDREGE